MIRGAYSGSWFNNLDDTLTWDNPLALTTRRRPRVAANSLWPSNSLQTLSTAGYAKSARRTQVTGSLAFGWWTTTRPCCRSRINSALTQFPLPRTTPSRGSHNRHERRPRVASAGRLAVQRTVPRYDYNNESLQTAIPHY